MKRLSILSFIAAAVALGFASCADNTEEFKKGAVDSPDCYGVYFPAQKTTLSLDPTDPTVDTILVARKKTEGAITVPYVLKDENNVFVATELKFEDGQSESYIALSFDSAKIGVTYICSILIEDPTYASQYTSNAIAIDLSVTRDKWTSIGTASFNDAFTFEGYYECDLLQNESDPTKYRLMHPYDGAIAARDGYKDENIVDEPCEYLPLFLLTPKKDKLYGIDITEPDLVYFEESSTGYYHTGYSALIYLNHPAEFSNLKKEEEWVYNYVYEYKDEKKTKPAIIHLSAMYYMYGVGAFNYHTDELTTILFPGVKLTDYSISIKPDFADEGEMDVAIKLGADVAYAEFSTFEGALNSAKVGQKADAIVAGEDSTATSIDSTCVVTLSFPATGDYTMVVVGYDADSVAQTVESKVLNYLAAKDSMPVDVDAELITTKKYEKFDYTTENSLEFSVYGSDLTSVAIGLFPSKKFYANPVKFIDEMLAEPEEDEEGYEVDAETLEEINETGYTDLLTDLKPGTAYTLVIIASNGYEQKIICKDASTTGVAIPLYMSFDASDIDDDLLPATASGYDGSYDFFAIPEDETDRQYISTLELKAINDSTVMATGMFDEFATMTGVHDTVYFEYYKGALYTLENYLEGDDDYTGAIRYWSDKLGKYYFDSYAMVGGFFDKDNIVFVDAFTGVDFSGWALSVYEGEELAGSIDFSNPLFATEGFYDELLGLNEPAPSRTSLNNLRAALNAPRTNFVETNRGYIRSTIKNFRDAQKIQSSGVKAGLSIESEPRAVKAKVVGVKAYQISKNSIESILK